MNMRKRHVGKKMVMLAILLAVFAVIATTFEEIWDSENSQEVPEATSHPEPTTPVGANVKFGNRQLGVVMNANGDLTAISNEQKQTNVRRMGLFSMTLAKKVYGLEPGKRRTIKLRPVFQDADYITLAPENEALPTFTFRTIDKGAYFILELVSMKDPADEKVLFLTMSRIHGTKWMPLDCVTKKAFQRLGDNPTFFGVLKRSENNPLGSIAMWNPKNAEEDDEILYQVWANENIPHPKVEGEWTVARAKQWISDYIKMRKEYDTQMIIGPRKPEDLKPIADEAKKFTLKKLYMHKNTWACGYIATDRDNFEVNDKMFPDGRKGMAAFGKYLEENGMKLTFRTTSYALGAKHPEYLGKVPDDRLATWWQGTLAKDTDATSKEITVREGSDHPTIYPLTIGQAEGRPEPPKPEPFFSNDNSQITNINCMRIGNELITFGKYVNNGDGTWTLKGCGRGLYNSEAASHKAGETARGLYRNYGMLFAPDPDSTLLDEMAKRFAEFHNEVNAGEANFDNLEAHLMMFPYGESKFVGEVYRHTLRPLYSSTSGASLEWGFIEPMFNSVKKALNPTPMGPFSPHGEMKVALHKSHWNASSPYAYVYGLPHKSAAGQEGHITEQSGYHDVTMETILGHGLMDYYVKVFKQWREIGPTLPDHIKKRIFSSGYKNPFNARFTLLDELVRFEGEGDALQVVPFRMMVRKNIDRDWTCHQEHGIIYPYQYIRPGQAPIRVSNPYHKQVPEFIIRVMPDFSRDIDSIRLTTKGETEEEKAFNDGLDKFQSASGVTLEKEAATNLSGKNISYRIMPDPATVQNKANMTFSAEGKGVRITSVNDTDQTLALVGQQTVNLPSYGVKTDITGAGGLGMVVTGDGSGAALVIRTGGQGTRDYVVHLDFKGKRYIEIPSPQASWADARWPFFDAYKRWRGNSVNRIHLGIDRVKPNSSSSVLLEDLRFLPEKPSTLNNPVIQLGEGSITINGVIPSGSHLWYRGGQHLDLYDINWNKIGTLPVTLNNAEVATGDVDISVLNHEQHGSPWLEVQFFVKDKGMSFQPIELLKDDFSQHSTFKRTGAMSPGELNKGWRAFNGSKWTVADGVLKNSGNGENADWQAESASEGAIVQGVSVRDVKGQILKLSFDYTLTAEDESLSVFLFGSKTEDGFEALANARLGNFAHSGGEYQYLEADGVAPLVSSVEFAGGKTLSEHAPKGYLGGSDYPALAKIAGSSSGAFSQEIDLSRWKHSIEDFDHITIVFARSAAASGSLVTIDNVSLKALPQKTGK